MGAPSAMGQQTQFIRRIGSGSVDFEPIKEAVGELQEAPNLIVEYLMPSCDNVPAILEDCRKLAEWHS